MYYEVAPVIVVKKESDHRQTFTLMHELGHVLLHRTSWIDESSDLYSYVGEEQEANAFAGQVLVTDAVVAAIDTGNRPDHVSDFDVWLEPTQNSIGVSVEVILRRLLDANELTQEEYRAYREWKGQAVFVETAGGNRAYRYREPMHMFGDAYVRTVLDAIHAGEITLTKASNYLDSIKVTAIHELEQYAHAHV